MRRADKLACLLLCVYMLPVALATVAFTDHAPIPLWPGVPPGERTGATGHETEGCETPGVPVSRCVDRSISNVTVPTLTPYLVAGATSAVVIAPGGAYKFLSWDREGTDIAAWLNSVGVSAFLLRYRVPGRAWLPFGSAPLMDAQRAVGLVREWAADGRAPGLNGSRVGVIGFSAGAHLAGHLSVAWRSRSYPRVDEADARPCRPDFVLMIYPWESVTEPPVSAGPDAASALNVTSRNPPTFLTQTEDDAAHVENSLYFYLALKKAGAAPSELHVYPEGGHGYGRCTKPTVPKGLAVCSWPHRAARFLQTLGVLPLL
mmetsp:Transcript_50985/g.161212  ORF Transcript_50985/g.161212 Transcript_50985/m.161212 type:complete len:317 (+) Transcript_50985:1-951(+)